MFIHGNYHLSTVEEMSIKLREAAENLYLLSLGNAEFNLGIVINFEQLEEIHNVLTIAVNEGEQ